MLFRASSLKKVIASASMPAASGFSAMSAAGHQLVLYSVLKKKKDFENLELLPLDTRGWFSLKSLSPIKQITP